GQPPSFPPRRSSDLVEDLAERPTEDALRLERVGDFAEMAVEIDQSGREVVEASVGLLAVLLEHERVHLLLEEPDLGRPTDASTTDRKSTRLNSSHVA